MQNATMASRLLALPQELQDQIISNLEFPQNILLKLTCRYFNVVISQLTLPQVLNAEKTEFARGRALHACYFCMRVRRSREFLDYLLRHMGHFLYNPEPRKRFCVGVRVEAREVSVPCGWEGSI